MFGKAGLDGPSSSNATWQTTSKRRTGPPSLGSDGVRVSTLTARRWLAAPLLAALLATLEPGLHLQVPSVQAASPVGGTYHPLSPVRILDTRTGLGGVPRARLGAGGTPNVQAAGHGGVPAPGGRALVLHTTGTSTPGPSFLTVWPGGTPLP